MCKLLKSLYGLKQAPRAWNIELNNAIIEYGLVRSEEDQCVYYRVEEENWILATFFVDDGLICGTSKKMIEKFVDHLKKKFELRTLPAGRFLGITMKKFKMEDCNSVLTLAEPGLKLSKNTSPKNNKEKEEMKQVTYKEAVGALLYISTTTRSDISEIDGDISGILDADFAHFHTAFILPLAALKKSYYDKPPSAANYVGHITRFRRPHLVVEV